MKEAFNRETYIGGIVVSPVTNYLEKLVKLPIDVIETIFVIIYDSVIECESCGFDIIRIPEVTLTRLTSNDESVKEAANFYYNNLIKTYTDGKSTIHSTLSKCLKCTGKVYLLKYVYNLLEKKGVKLPKIFKDKKTKYSLVTKVIVLSSIIAIVYYGIHLNNHKKKRGGKRRRNRRRKYIN